ncbi:MAG: hypothetical protein LAO77_22790 [Acidobacteriia bacterium]|nr:hypothetical protein [Terriglobia bacterium]
MSTLEGLLNKLATFYGALPTPPRDPFTLFVWEVLSVHSTPYKRDAALAALKRIRALTPDAMWRAPQKKLEQAVGLAGPYNEQRLRALRTGVDMFRRSPRLPEMGEGGAYRMLLFAADHPVLPVDARVSRVARRLGFGDQQGSFTKTARSVREAIAKQLRGSPDAYRHAFLYLAHHGGATCTEGDPHCAVCPLLENCPEGKKRQHV